MAEINNLEDIKTNFEKITNLINSMRAQGVLSFSGVDKVLTAINNKIDNLNLDENADLLKLLIGEVKNNIEERHGFVVSKFAEIESSINIFPFILQFIASISSLISSSDGDK